jgi:hypothetical protein
MSNLGREALSNNRRKTLSDIQEDRKAQANALAKAARTAAKASQHEPILKWKEGSSDIVGWKHDIQASYPVAAHTTHSPAGSLRTPAQAAAASSPGPSSPGPPMTGHQRSLLFSDQVHSTEPGYGLLTDQGIPPPEDGITQKMLSLPDIVCKAASGDIFIVGLSDVQEMLHKRRLGPKGHAILKRFEANSTAGWDLERDREIENIHLAASADTSTDVLEVKTKGTKKRRPKAKLPSSEGDTLGLLPSNPRTSTQGRRISLGGRQVSMTGSTLGLAHGAKDPNDSRRQSKQGISGGEMDGLDEVLRKHVEHTVALVEAHREHLKATSGKYLAEQQKLSEAAKIKNHRQNAIVSPHSPLYLHLHVHHHNALTQEFIINKFLPEKLLHMAKIFKSRRKESESLEGLLDEEEKEILESSLATVPAAGEAGPSSTLASGEGASSSFSFGVSVSAYIDLIH